MTAVVEGGAPAAGGGPLGLYVHVPFCRTRCRYCDFYRVGENRQRMDRFLAALEREIRSLPEAGAAADTVFFGGGTPSLLAPEEIAAILAWLGGAFRLAPDAEITVEANPSDLDPDRLARLRRAGVNRLSVGVQSFNDRELALLGRRHDGERAARVLAWARQAGFDNLNLDLMAAIPGQTVASLRATLARAIELRPDHLSLYLLEVHPTSEMDFLRRERPRLFPGEEGERRRYLLAAELLEADGYQPYEISNFCRPGRQCRHNLKYWRCTDTLGLGPAAHSAVGGRRWQHPADLGRYLAAPGERQPLPAEPAQERVFLGLRLAEGVGMQDVARAAGMDGEALAHRLGDLLAFVAIEGGRLRLTREGRLVSTAVIAELLTAGSAPAPLPS